MIIRESLHLNGKEIALETGQLARQASGAVLASYGDTRVLVTATFQEQEEDRGYFPLRVDYEERFYASGKIPGGFFKREGRPSDTAILNARMIDRPIRPLFPDGYNDEVQIVATILSVEPDCQPGIVGILGASAALLISGAPFAGPIAGVKVGRKDGQLIVNPTAEELATVDITIAGSKNTVTMVEGGMDEIPEEGLVTAIETAHESIKELVALQERFVERVRPKKKEVSPGLDEDPALKDRVRKLVWPEFDQLSKATSKQARNALIDSLKQRALQAVVTDETPLQTAEQLKKTTYSLVEDYYKEFMRAGIIERGIRIDGRRPEELRPITCRVEALPRAHGSAIFTRGETQSLGIVTLGATRSDEQVIDQMTKEGRKRFMLHYNFPPYSVGEVGRIGSPKRRSIGHGYLAEGALRAVLPKEEEFPYVIRVVSEILESNGSSSMATVCSGSLAMMDAGVPISKPVAGVAMGLIQDPATNQNIILTDILGVEDHFGDMDFKVAGTRDGVTAFQLDVKLGGIDQMILREALERARQARLAILDEMTRTIPAPRGQLSTFAPRLETMNIPQEKIGLVIGPGGKMIRSIIEETGADIDIEDDGQVKLAGPDNESVAAARKRIEGLTAELEVGAVFNTRVTRIADFGAFVELNNGTEGLVHVSNLAAGYVDNVRDIVSPGDEITIEVIGEDKRGRPDLRRVEQPTQEATDREEKVAKKKAPRPNIQVGDRIEGKVVNTTNYGAFVELAEGITGLVHISALSDEYVKRVEDVVKPGDTVTVEVLAVEGDNRYKLRRVSPKDEKTEEAEVTDFEDRW